MKGPARLLLLHGMKRSGNHALVNWLLPQFEAAFVNNLVPVGELLRGKPMPTPVSFADWRQRRREASGCEATSWLVSLEDHPPSLQPFRDIDVPCGHVVLVRDPWQLFSSRIRKAFRVQMPAYPRSNDAVMQRAVGLWKQHARCYLRRDGRGGAVAVLFDTWVRDREYRRAVSTALGLAFDDAGFGRVSGEGGGSSFDGTRFDGDGHRMDLANRVAALTAVERALLDEIFADAELADLASAVQSSDPARLIAP